MYIVIIGCGTVGPLIANSLSKEGHDVVVDNDETSFENLSSEFSGFRSFTTHYLLLRLKFKEVLRTGELRLLIFILAVTVPVVLYLVTMMTYVNFSDSLRVAIFQVVSPLCA
ncbi:MAG: NAD-binding protein [Pseudomonadota bacterium]